jgi:sulfite reductase alpha subunit-like flavoprotein
MKQFWRFLLRRDLPATVLSKLHFSTFGLGDSGYPIYNAVARRLHERLSSLGANELCVRGLGDDQHQLGYDGGLVPWMDIFFEALLRHAPLPPGVTVSADLLSDPQFEVEVFPADECEDGPPALPANLPISAAYHEALSQPLAPYGDGTARYTPVPARVQRNLRLSPEGHSQDLRHVEIDLSALPKDQQSYLPGDVLHIHPPCPRALVDAALKLWGLHANDCLAISPATPGNKVDVGMPAVVRAWELFTWYIDLAAVPQRYIFEILAQVSFFYPYYFFLIFLAYPIISSHSLFPLNKSVYLSPSL